MANVYFSEVSTVAEKSGKCVVCGKACKLKKKFYQTLNPFNKNSEGVIKTKEMIMQELIHEVKEWKLIPTIHVKCQ